MILFHTTLMQNATTTTTNTVKVIPAVNTVAAETVTDIIKHFEKLEEPVMYRYEYETVSCELGGWGFGSGNIYSIGDYQSVINKRAEEGWRYVGCIPTKQRGTGHTQEMDFIFEKMV